MGPRPETVLARAVSIIHTAPIATDMGGLVEGLVTEHGRGATPFGIYVLDPTQPESELARTIERQVFDELFPTRPS